MRDDDPMNTDQSPAGKAQSLQTLATGPIASSLSTLSSSSRAIPTSKDFHFFNNFDEFKLPLEEIAAKSLSMLESVGSAARLWGKKQISFPGNVDIDSDDAYDWLINVNDEILERFDVSIDEFERMRKKEEETGRPFGSEMVGNGFQLVSGKKKKKDVGFSGSDSLGVSGSGKEQMGSGSSSSGVQVKKAVAGTGKAKVPFHIPTIRRPQQEYNILVNNANQPFEHVWLERSEDGQRLIHPLEKASVMDFVDKDIENYEPVKPPAIESTPFKLVEQVKDLKELAAKLRNVNEFAVDLEHNQYRSFQGLTCLMQISTRTEDFIVDTLKLRVHVGPYLREVFKDPTKKKVMHGADRDIVWLQRDFGIYISNLFDTGQASRVLKLERNSLEYLLYHFCGVTANKEYQNADWRLRPLPDEMIRYARDDTHYLLYIYDAMKTKLFSMPKESENSDAPLLEVYKRSYDVCMQLYEKELLTESSYLHIYGLPAADLKPGQLAIVAGLCEWRDLVARIEDESTGYVLPNKTLIEIAKQVPITTSKLRRIVKSKHPYVERNLDSVVNIIRRSLQNAPAYEDAAQQLREGRMVTLTGSEENPAVNKGAEASTSETPIDLNTGNDGTDNMDGAVAVTRSMNEQPASPQLKDKLLEIGSIEKKLSSEQPGANGSSRPVRESLNISIQSGEINASKAMPLSEKVTGASVQVLKKPSRGFGALLGSAATKRKSDIDKKEEESKLEQIRSSVSLPFYSFVGKDEQLIPVSREPSTPPEAVKSEDPPAGGVSDNRVDIIMLEDDSNAEESRNSCPEDTDIVREENPLEMKNEDEPVSLSDLSTSFQKCFKSINENRNVGKVKKPQEASGLLQVKPFDYEAARKELEFGDAEKEAGSQKGNQKKDTNVGQVQRGDGTNELRQGRRRHAFPASGNRSATFR